MTTDHTQRYARSWRSHHVGGDGGEEQEGLEAVSMEKGKSAGTRRMIKEERGAQTIVIGCLVVCWGDQGRERKEWTKNENKAFAKQSSYNFASA